jgi:hypothetical protein
MDGKHIRILKLAGRGSYFYNYKDYCSIVSLAILNAECDFIYVNAACNGRNSDEVS